jgi:hypothetical protein
LEKAAFVNEVSEVNEVSKSRLVAFRRPAAAFPNQA